MSRYLGADEVPLHYDDVFRGEGEAWPIVVLAGGAARHPAYLGDLAGLDHRYRLIVPHLRGVGESPMPATAESGSYWRQAEDVERLRAHLGLERVVLLGHSAGTRLAVSYAAQFPQRLAGMVLVTPPAGYLVDVPSDAADLMEKRRGDPVFDAAMAALGVAPDTDDDDLYNAWQQRTAPVGYASWTAAEQAHAGSGRWHLAAARAYFSVDPPGDLAARLGEVSAPVLVVAGAQDCLTGLAPVLALATLFPAGRAEVIDECGHYPWVEQPAVFRQVVDPFLAERVGASPHRPSAG